MIDTMAQTHIDAFGSGFPEQTTVYTELVATSPHVNYMALKNKISLYNNAVTNEGSGLVVYREEVWSLILEKSVQAVIPFLEEWISTALSNMHTALDSITCLEDDNEEMIEWTVDSRRFMHSVINNTAKMSESLKGTSWDERMGILELYADLKYYAHLHKSEYFKQTSTHESWNRDALLLLRWHIGRSIAEARKELMGWRTYGGDTSHHDYDEHTRTIIQNAFREVTAVENDKVVLACLVLQANINAFLQCQITRFKDDMLISCFQQVRSLTLTVNKLCEKLQIAGQVLSM